MLSINITVPYVSQVISFNTAVEATEKDLHVAPGRGGVDRFRGGGLGDHRAKNGGFNGIYWWF